ncbi:MAG: XdhC family protein [Acidobacteriota bacterium]|jgi:xanthine dehydrogenase accessory factor
MKAAMLSLAAKLTAAGEPFAVATVVRREAPSSAQLGDTAIVTRDGRLHGFIGGSCTRATVVDQALQVLASARARLISFQDDGSTRADDIVSVPMTCHSGGSVEIYIDPVFPVPRLLLLGSSPVNRALARLGTAMPYTVVLSGGAESDATDGEEEVAALDDLAGFADRNDGVKLFVLVATMGESDEDMLAAAITAQPDYLGVIASRRRMEEITATLRARGIDEAVIGTIDGPAGLDLGATRPEEIAVSVLAEIVERQRRPGDDDGTSPRAATAGAAATEAPSPTAGAPAAPASGVDPVCGMSVPADGSKPHAEHAGITYHFCCSGCRDRFVADPGQYVEAGAAADPGTRP